MISMKSHVIKNNNVVIIVWLKNVVLLKKKYFEYISYVCIYEHKKRVFSKL
jgi:hypothetical protein